MRRSVTQETPPRSPRRAHPGRRVRAREPSRGPIIEPMLVALLDRFEKPLEPGAGPVPRPLAAEPPAPEDPLDAPVDVAERHLPPPGAAAVRGAVAVVPEHEHVAGAHHLVRPLARGGARAPALHHLVGRDAAGGRRLPARLRRALQL